MNKRTFRGKARDWTLGESQNGKERVGVVFDVLTPGADLTTATWYGYFTEATAERTIEALRYCGWEGDDLTRLDGLDANEVDLVIEDEEYEGKLYAKVQWVNRAGGTMMQPPLAEDRARAFAASMRERIRAVDATQGRRRTAAKPRPASSQSSSAPLPGQLGPEPPPLGDDDLPF